MLKGSPLSKKNTKFTGELRDNSQDQSGKFSGYYFYLKPNIQGDFKISISVS